jgi:excisionase family DNA binding protein
MIAAVACGRCFGTDHVPLPGGLMCVHQVAAYAGVREDWIYARSRAGDIPTVQLGRYKRFRPEAIERWVRELERGG